MIKYKAGYKYQLAETVEIQTDFHPDEPIKSKFIWLYGCGVMRILSHYAWDGPSGPTLDTKSFMRGSLAHDAAYQLIREGKLTVKDARKKADQLLRSICIEDGMTKMRAWWVYQGVRIGGKKSSKQGRKILEAP